MTVAIRRLVVTVVKNEPPSVPRPHIFHESDLMIPQPDPRSVERQLDDRRHPRLQVAEIREVFSGELLSELLASMLDAARRPFPANLRFELKALDPLDPCLSVTHLPHKRGGIGRFPRTRPMPRRVSR